MLIRSIALVLLLLTVSLAHADTQGERPADGDFPADFREFDYQATLRYSQEAIGRTLGDHRFTNSRGEAVALSDFAGRPMVIQLVFTSCYYICSTSTKNLARVVQIARNALGPDSFTVLTIGFDTPNDTPEAMRAYARQQGVDVPNWEFLSADKATIDALTAELGFVYYPSPRGFDHLVQSSVIDQEGVIYRQVYGEVFNTPLLVEPLKQLVLGGRVEESALEALSNRVRLFCTTYDPTQDRYFFDYSLFIGIAIGALIIGSTLAFLLREYLRWRRRIRVG
ncbi:MAG TPA: SCO family protein [Rhodocyclaceae bacterium]|nr:SCO family protein [Rhodocyclaceae bacterium]